MKTSVLLAFTAAIGICSQASFAGEIADTYATGDTLTATTLNNIKTAVNDNNARIAELEKQLAELAGLLQLKDKLVVIGDTTVQFRGVNVQIVDGTGATDSTSGLGNLIVGYNEESADSNKTGTHNLVVGRYNNYSSYGGFVAGEFNRVTAPAASVSGGLNNIASAKGASVSGGQNNIAGGNIAGDEFSLAPSVSGGYFNMARGVFSSVSGGRNNEAAGIETSVSGGIDNTALGTNSSILGGNTETTLLDDETIPPILPPILVP